MERYQEAVLTATDMCAQQIVSQFFVTVRYLIYVVVLKVMRRANPAVSSAQESFHLSFFLRLFLCLWQAM